MITDPLGGVQQRDGGAEMGAIRWIFLVSLIAAGFFFLYGIIRAGRETKKETQEGQAKEMPDFPLHATTVIGGGSRN